MPTTISCFSYRQWDRVPFHFIFIKYENFVKVILNSKSVIFTNYELASNQILFQIFILSLLLTKDISCISSVFDKNKIKYGVETLRHWKKSKIADYYEFVEIDNGRNPLNSMEPKRASSDKKMRKFFKMFINFCEDELIKDPIIIVDEYITRESDKLFNYFDRYIHHEVKINILSRILHTYGHDVCKSVNRFI